MQNILRATNFTEEAVTEIHTWKLSCTVHLVQRGKGLMDIDCPQGAAATRSCKSTCLFLYLLCSKATNVPLLNSTLFKIAAACTCLLASSIAGWDGMWSIPWGLVNRLQGLPGSNVEGP